MNLHIEDEFKFGLKLWIVNFEHGLHELLLVNVLIAILVHNLEKSLAEDTR
jgi:hypothetical protein